MIAAGSKLALVAEALAAGDEAKAVALAGKINRLPGNGRALLDVVGRALAARRNPAFYEEIGKNPDELWKLGIAATRQIVESYEKEAS